MSQDLEQIMRDGYERFNRGDVDAVLELLDPRIEWWPASDELVVEPYRGHEGYRRLYWEAREGVPDLQVEIEEVTVVADRAVACIRFFGRGRESRAPVEVRETHVARMRAGKLVEVREYRTKEEALRAVAKSE
jgi:ketosteroid isomerase-like protein